MTEDAKKVCIVTGVGPGTGAAIATRFAQGGYAVAMLARGAARLSVLSGQIPNSYPYPCDVADPAALTKGIERINRELGAAAVVVHNAVSGTFGDFLQIDPADLERNFRVNTLGLLHLARLTVPAMMKARRGAILCTGNTSAYRGKANFAAFAPTKAAQRVLLESIARTLGPQGVHAAYVAIDAVIDVPWTRDRMPDKPDDYFCRPEDIADECFRVAHQPKSAWSFNVEIRPFGELW
jgi:NAD(P)-dependent dehydrogenase (short-subunit alcohol dehydrogenase family)